MLIAVVFLALRAYPGDFDHRVVDRETEIVRLRQQPGIRIFKFGHLFTTPADQELGRAMMPGMHTADKRIAALEAVHKPLRQQEFEGAVYDRRGDAFSAGGAIQFCQYVVGAEWLMASQQDFQHLAAARSEAQLARFAQAPRR